MVVVPVTGLRDSWVETVAGAARGLLRRRDMRPGFLVRFAGARVVRVVVRAMFGVVMEACGVANGFVWIVSMDSRDMFDR